MAREDRDGGEEREALFSRVKSTILRCTKWLSDSDKAIQREVFDVIGCSFVFYGYEDELPIPDLSRRSLVADSLTYFGIRLERRDPARFIDVTGLWRVEKSDCFRCYELLSTLTFVTMPMIRAVAEFALITDPTIRESPMGSADIPPSVNVDQIQLICSCWNTVSSLKARLDVESMLICSV